MGVALMGVLLALLGDLGGRSALGVRLMVGMDRRQPLVIQVAGKRGNESARAPS